MCRYCDRPALHPHMHSSCATCRELLNTDRAAGTFDDPMTHSVHIVSFGITAALGAWALYASAKG